MRVSGRPPGIFSSSAMNAGKLLRRLFCSSRIELELSTRNSRSSCRSGFTSYSRSVCCSGAGLGCSSGCELQAHSRKGTVAAASAQRSLRQTSQLRKLRRTGPVIESS